MLWPEHKEAGFITLIFFPAAGLYAMTPGSGVGRIGGHQHHRSRDEVRSLASRIRYRRALFLQVVRALERSRSREEEEVQLVTWHQERFVWQELL